jgi:hypothetical protein
MTGFSIVVFPFLKTGRPIRLGGLTFRATKDIEGLPDEQAAAVTEINGLLYAQDDYRIANASYAITAALDLDRAPHNIPHLEDIHSVVAYLYSSFNVDFGKPFLPVEHATVVVFTPGVFSQYLVHPVFNVVRNGAPVVADQDTVRGYAGLYNFRHHFWVTVGSRVYAPVPHPMLNIGQDLSVDIERAAGQVTYSALLRLLDKPHAPIASRALTALRWYASANREATEDYAVIVHLSIAFEALLGLPQSEKTDRLVDSISLLLGRVPRLDTWARQFYDARSKIVHEGRADSLRFTAGDPAGKREAQLYQSLFSYGSQIFRLCLGTLLVGAELAEAAALSETFVTNGERFAALCAILSDSQRGVEDKFDAAAKVVDAIERYRFVGETGLQTKTMIGSIRLAARHLMASGIILEPTVHSAFTTMIECRGSQSGLAELEALRGLDEVLSNSQPAGIGSEDVVRRIVKVVWGYVFMHHYWLKKRHTETEDQASPSIPLR